MRRQWRDWAAHAEENHTWRSESKRAAVWRNAIVIAQASGSITEIGAT
jgi:hypothetical protein